MAADPSGPAPDWPPVELLAGQQNRVDVLAWLPGRYELQTAGGKAAVIEAKGIPEAIPVTGPWELSFPPDWGAPQRVTLERLMSWSDHNDTGVKYFSGMATYRKTISVPAAMLGKDRRLCLDLGNVQVMAQVKLNGKDLGILWKPPFRVDITSAVKAGENTLEVVVANVWANRLIGDRLLPPAKRYTRTSGQVKLANNAPLAESGLLGPVRIVTAQNVDVVFNK